MATIPAGLNSPLSVPVSLYSGVPSSRSMTTPRQRQFLSLQAGWMLLAIALLASAGRLTGELVFVASFVGLVVVTALTEPVHATVDWRGRLRWPLAVGALVFAAFVAVRTFEKFVGSL